MQKKDGMFSATVMQAFAINKSPLPWEKAISAGVCAGLPVLVGLLLGNLPYGLIAGIGSFSPVIAGFSNITKEMEDLQEALQAIGKVRIS
ncbi:hypothetical protein T458_27120 [Brevibacillus panacihumi W25]|uniref:Uncharacterized protein n=1 Tax=Brevibacillus panacihumi W25 TaxID=1408254 RepID=V6M2W8_9BACL|nr:hypothetical protein [Brevibacillus panacihumi]EST52230.1 hypothetical protein T458_27120 [Brevibacillus panacihumi W25]